MIAYLLICSADVTPLPFGNTPKSVVPTTDECKTSHAYISLPLHIWKQLCNEVQEPMQLLCSLHIWKQLSNSFEYFAQIQIHTSRDSFSPLCPLNYSSSLTMGGGGGVGGGGVGGKTKVHYSSTVHAMEFGCLLIVDSDLV